MAWLYILRDIPCHVIEKNVIIQHHRIISNEAVLMKVQITQQSFELMLQAHLLFAQKLFGTAAGIGTRVPLKCRLKQKRLLAEAEDRHQIQYSDMVNVTPFENHNNNTQEFVRRGIVMSYIPSEHELTVIVRFRVMNGQENLMPHLHARNMLINNGNVNEGYPLHSNIALFDSFISKVNLNGRTVAFKNGTVLSIDDVINEINRIIF